MMEASGFDVATNVPPRDKKPADWQVVTIAHKWVEEVDCNSGDRRRIYRETGAVTYPPPKIHFPRECKAPATRGLFQGATGE